MSKVNNVIFQYLNINTYPPKIKYIAMCKYTIYYHLKNIIQNVKLYTYTSVQIEAIKQNFKIYSLRM